MRCVWASAMQGTFFQGNTGCSKPHRAHAGGSYHFDLVYLQYFRSMFIVPVESVQNEVELLHWLKRPLTVSVPLNVWHRVADSLWKLHLCCQNMIHGAVVLFFLATVILLLLFTDDSHWLFVFTLCCLCVRIQIRPDFKTRLLLNASIWNNYVMFISHFVVADTCRHWAAGSPQAVGDGTGGLPRQRCLSKHPKDAGPLFGLKNVKLHQP